MSYSKIPCGGFYYDDATLMFTKDENGYPILKRKPALEKVADYLYEVEYDSYDYAEGRKFMERYKAPMSCSVAKKGDIVGRNLDWYYGNEAEVVVRTKAVNGRHATIGVAHSPITNIDATLGEWDKYVGVLPFLMSDCLNDQGVYANMNVVPAGDKGLTYGTNPDAPFGDVCQLMIPRYVCDYASSAKQAIELIEDANIYAPLEGFGGMECHILLCDATNTYIIEFINNQMVVLSSTDTDYDPIPNNIEVMTNFYMAGWDGNIKAVFLGDTKAETEATGLTQHSMGLERYNILAEALGDVSDVDDMGDLMQEVEYTLAYDNDMSPVWYSEFLGGSSFGDITITSTAQEVAQVRDIAVDWFEHRERDKKTWYTTHTAVYDLVNKVVHVFVDEDYANRYSFKLKVLGEID